MNSSVVFYLSKMDSDISQNAIQPYLESPNVHAVMVEEWSGPKLHKVIPSPIGACRSFYVPVAKEWTKLSITSTPFLNRTSKVYGCFNDNTGGHRNRVQARKFLQGRCGSNCFFCRDQDSHHLHISNYHDEMTRFKLVFMPFGNAYERFATFEALWLGLIVVMIDWPGAAEAYQGLPVVRIRKFDDINRRNIELWVASFTEVLTDLPRFRRTRLTMAAWSRRIDGIASGIDGNWSR